MKNVEKELKKLNKALKANENVTKGIAFDVADQTSLADAYLNEKAKELMKKKGKTIVLQKDGAVLARSVYFSAVVAKNNVEAGIKKMAEIANELADKDLACSVLAPVSSINLAVMAGQLPKCAVFFFPHIFIDKADEVEKMEFATKEGGIGKDIGDTSLVLPKGEFWAEANLIHDIETMRYGHACDIDGRLFDLVQEYLNVLPPGTKFLGANRCAIISLAIPYELRFFNPLLENVRNVEIEYTRAAAAVDDKLIQGNIFTGIEYFDRDGKRLYSYEK